MDMEIKTHGEIQRDTETKMLVNSGYLCEIRLSFIFSSVLCFQQQTCYFCKNTNVKFIPFNKYTWMIL